MQHQMATDAFELNSIRSHAEPSSHFSNDHLFTPCLRLNRMEVKRTKSLREAAGMATITINEVSTRIVLCTRLPTLYQNQFSNSSSTDDCYLPHFDKHSPLLDRLRALCLRLMYVCRATNDDMSSATISSRNTTFRTIDNI